MSTYYDCGRIWYFHQFDHKTEVAQHLRLIETGISGAHDFQDTVKHCFSLFSSHGRHRHPQVHLLSERDKTIVRVVRFLGI